MTEALSMHACIYTLVLSKMYCKNYFYLSIKEAYTAFLQQHE